MESRSHIHPDSEVAKNYFTTVGGGPVVMLNLLRYREEADYAASPKLDPGKPISGEEAYKTYMAEVGPLIQAAGSEVIFMGKGGANLIGPANEHWDLVLLVRHQSAARFMQFAQDPAYLKVAGHRTAALADSRLLPIQQG